MILQELILRENKKAIEATESGDAAAAKTAQENAGDLISAYGDLGTEVAQGLNVFALYTRLTPEGMLIHGEKLVGKTNKKARQAVKPVSKDATKALRDADDKAKADVSNEAKKRGATKSKVRQKINEIVKRERRSGGKRGSIKKSLPKSAIDRFVDSVSNRLPERTNFGVETRDNPVADMLFTLREVVAERGLPPISREAATRTDIEKIGRALRSQQRYWR